MYYLQNNGRYLRNNGVLLNNGNQSYGLNFNGNQQVLFDNNILTLAQSFLQPNLSFSVSISFRVDANMFNPNGQGNFLWLNNNSLYDGVNTKGLNVVSVSSGFVSIILINLNLGVRVTFCSINPSDLNEIVNITFTHDGNVFKSYYKGYLQQTGTTGTISGVIDYTTGVTPGIRYNNPVYNQKGVIYDIKIYNKELNATECFNQSIYNNIISNCIYHIPFNSLVSSTTPEIIQGLPATLSGYSLGEQPIRDINNNIVTQYTI